jgi:hypothetical protein
MEVDNFAKAVLLLKNEDTGRLVWKVRIDASSKSSIRSAGASFTALSRAALSRSVSAVLNCGGGPACCRIFRISRSVVARISS